MPVAPPSPLRVRRRRVPERWRVDSTTLAAVVVSVLFALALLAVFTLSSTMLTRIGIGVLIALALDPLVDSLERRLPGRRGTAVAVVGVAVLGVAALLVLVLGPQAVEQVRLFSHQLPETIDQLGKLPLVGGWVRDQDLSTKAQRWIDDLPERFTDQRLAESAGTLVSGVVSVATVVVVSISVLIDGENLIGRVRRLIAPAHRRQADEVGRVVYRTIGRYVGGSVTVALLMGMYVLTVGLDPRRAARPAGGDLGDDHRPHPAGRWLPRRVVLRAPRPDQGVPTAIVAGGLFVVYMNIENHVIQPAIVGRSVNLTAPTTMVAAFVGGAVAGVPGALVATPLAGAAKQLFLEMRGRAAPEPLIDRRPGAVVRARNHVRSLLPRRRRDDAPPTDRPDAT